MLKDRQKYLNSPRSDVLALIISYYFFNWADHLSSDPMPVPPPFRVLRKDLHMVFLLSQQKAACQNGCTVLEGNPSPHKIKDWKHWSL